MIIFVKKEMYYHRNIEKELKRSIQTNPVTVILGPRQCGKSTLAKEFIKNRKSSVYLDLERPSDLNKLQDADFYLSAMKGKLICIDEIQRKPELFPLLRSLCDEWGGNSRFLILGSASRELIRQSSETLAGRVRYLYLCPFLFDELIEKIKLTDYMVRGGFPRSILEKKDLDSFAWRESFITTFLERDLLLWAGFSPNTMRRLWQMLAYNNGQTVNFSQFGSSLGVSNGTVRNYIELLQGTFMVNVVHPFASNLNKRLVRSPKVYLNDAGIINALLGIQSLGQLIGNHVYGSLWESVVLSHIKARFPEVEISFYRTSHGAELDFVLTYRQKHLGIECKAGTSPSLEKGAYFAMDDIRPVHTIIVCPVDKGWPVKQNVTVAALPELYKLIKKHFGI